jgi:FixJ family two-component response regulator
MGTEQKAPLIVVVDDDAALREATECLVRSVGYQAQSFASAVDFVQSDCTSRTSCLILDVRLPGMTGLELQRVLAQAGWRIPIVFISAQEDRDGRMRSEALRAGALGFFRKPFDDEELLNRIRAACVMRSEGHTPA